MNWQDVIKIKEKDIFDSRKPSRVVYNETWRRGYDAAEIIEKNDPHLFDKLNAHFEANPLINDEMRNMDFFYYAEDIRGNKIDPKKGFHWEEAFTKHGFEGGHFDEFSNIVDNLIKSLGYETHRPFEQHHNNPITRITLRYIDVEDVSNRRLGSKRFIDVGDYSTTVE
tara:strand:- start:555 stop:1058 length:504 start_codon:yes stop_codon:yes gene_type:complete